MFLEELTPEEKELARQLWELSLAEQKAPELITRAFQMVPIRVREAVDYATQTPEYCAKEPKNPFEA